MHVAVLHTQVPFTSGGAEAQASNLVDAIRAHGHKAEIVSLPFRWYPAELVLDHMLASRLLNVAEANGTTIDVAIGLKFPAYLIPHPRKVLWIMHQFRQAYDLWESPYGDLQHSPSGLLIREAVRQADLSCFAEARAVYTTTRNVAGRMLRYNNFVASPLYHPPPGAERFYAGEYGSYLYFPSRINQLKRQRLVLQAMTKTRSDVSIVFSGAPEDQSLAATLIQMTKEFGLEGRVSWKGHVSESEKLSLYANCRAVVFAALDEDYGYVPLEGMLAGKCLVVCSDSGGGKEFVEGGETGLIVEPTPDSLAETFDKVWADARSAAAMGRKALEKVKTLDLSWERVVERLLA